jgi:hypothetical protein
VRVKAASWAQSLRRPDIETGLHAAAQVLEIRDPPADHHYMINATCVTANRSCRDVDSNPGRRWSSSGRSIVYRTTERPDGSADSSATPRPRQVLRQIHPAASLA